MHVLFSFSLFVIETEVLARDFLSRVRIIVQQNYNKQRYSISNKSFTSAETRTYLAVRLLHIKIHKIKKMILFTVQKFAVRFAAQSASCFI